MRKVFFSLALSSVFYTSGAQNNPIFYGGPGDGQSTGGDLQASVNINDGGNGDGFARGGFLPVFMNINQGGNGDGFSKAGFFPAVINHNSGGNGDGFAKAGFLPVFMNINQGGNGDGWMVSGYLPPVMNINTGGNGDGWTFSGVLQPSLNIYLGGVGDGWASTYSPAAPLPLSFLKFDALKEGRNARLNWEMANDDDVSFFEVERSTDAVNFGAIGRVGQDNTLHLKYGFLDDHTLAGSNYYRIKIHGKDGKSVYTPTRVVSFDDPAGSTALKVYPIPAHDFITIEFPQQYLGHNTAVNIYGAGGAMVKQLRLSPLKGASMDLNISELTDGDYFIHVASDNAGASVKIVKLSR